MKWIGEHVRVVDYIASGRFCLTVVAFLKKLELYKSRNLSLTPTASPTSRPLRQPCYSPDEFHRGIQAMQSWFRNLDDSQRTLALQSITVRTTFLTARFFWSKDPYNRYVVALVLLWAHSKILLESSLNWKFSKLKVAKIAHTCQNWKLLSC